MRLDFKIEKKFSIDREGSKAGGRQKEAAPPMSFE